MLDNIVIFFILGVGIYSSTIAIAAGLREKKLQSIILSVFAYFCIGLSISSMFFCNIWKIFGECGEPFFQKLFIFFFISIGVAYISANFYAAERVHRRGNLYRTITGLLLAVFVFLLAKEWYTFIIEHWYFITIIILLLALAFCFKKRISKSEEEKFAKAPTS